MCLCVYVKRYEVYMLNIYNVISNWFTYLWKLESLILDKLANWKLRVGVEVFRLKFVEETNSLETQTGVERHYLESEICRVGEA